VWGALSSYVDRASTGGLAWGHDGGFCNTLVKANPALFAREFSDLLICSEGATPGPIEEIACLLADKTTTGKLQKVKEYLRRRSKKSGARR
jgi:hypothetical protein